MDIKKLDDRYFELMDPDGSVSFNLPGYISLIVGPLHQLFKNPRSLEAVHLPSVYVSLDRVKQDAECYTEGITNKEMFLKKVHDQEFIKKHNLKTEDQKFLKEFILNTCHKPPTIVQQLYMKGYSRIADDMDFADPMPELEKSCEIFWQFVKNLKHVT